MRVPIIVLSVIILGCHEQNKNKISPAELVKSREIRKVSEAELLKGASSIGETLAQTLDSLVGKKVNEDSITCQTESWSAVDSLAKMFDSRIRLIRPQSKDLLQLEYQLLEAYQYNVENNLPLSPSVQKLDEKTVLYTAPLKFLNWEHCPDSLNRVAPHIWSMKISIKEVIKNL